MKTQDANCLTDLIYGNPSPSHTSAVSGVPSKTVQSHSKRTADVIFQDKSQIPTVP